MSTAQDDIDENWVRHSARLVGIEITDDQLPGVLANLKRTAQIAAAVTAVALDEQDELGPVWRP